MEKLNKDQLYAFKFLKNWWTSPSRFAILEGEAGTGKTFLLTYLVQELKCDALFTAPTNEACRQLELALPENSLVRTTYSALGFNFSTSSEVKELKQGRLPPILDDVNLLVVDECSMIGEVLFEAIKNTNLKVLFLGDNLQLPEVKVGLEPSDKCKSIVFEQGFPVVTLLKNQRAGGELYEYIKSLRDLIYSEGFSLEKNINYSFNEIKLLSYIQSESGKKELLNAKSKIICYSNNAVDNYNKLVRESNFGKNCATFVPTDKLILTRPTTFVGNLANKAKHSILKMQSKDQFRLSTNSHVEVNSVKDVVVLGLRCYELTVTTHQGIMLPLYVVKDKKEYDNFCYALRTECYGKVSKQAKDKAWKEYHYLLNLFTDCKYSYCLTAHRSQGMTIDKVYVVWKNIQLCSNRYLKYKLLYVAASRARKELFIII